MAPLVPIVCPVCLSKLSPEDNLSNPGCGHVFHTSCIKDWFECQTSRTCPHCRSVCRGGKLSAVYLQFDENSLNDTMREFDTDSPSNVSNNASAKELENKLRSVTNAYNAYKIKSENEKAETAQAISIFSDQVDSLESSLREKTQEISLLGAKFETMKDVAEKKKHECARKELKIKALQNKLEQSEQMYQAQVNRPCAVRELLNAKSTEIKEKVANYKQMGDHGLQVLAEFALASNSETKKLKDEIRDLKIKFELQKSKLHVKNNEPVQERKLSPKLVRNRSEPLSKPETTSACTVSSESENLACSSSCDTIATVSLKPHSPSGKENGTTDDSSDCDDSICLLSPVIGSAPKKRVFVAVDTSNDILVEASPGVRHSSKNVKGSLLARKNESGSISHRNRYPLRKYNGLGASTNPLFVSRSFNN